MVNVHRRHRFSSPLNLFKHTEWERLVHTGPGRVDRVMCELLGCLVMLGCFSDSLSGAGAGILPVTLNHSCSQTVSVSSFTFWMFSRTELNCYSYKNELAASRSAAAVWTGTWHLIRTALPRLLTETRHFGGAHGHSASDETHLALIHVDCALHDGLFLALSSAELYGMHFEYLCVAHRKVLCPEGHVDFVRTGNQVSI